MRNETYPPKATFESAWASIQELTKSVKTMSANIEESSKKWEEQTIENQKIYDSIKAMQQEFCGMGKSSGEKWEKQQEIDRKKIEESSKIWEKQTAENQKIYDSIKAMQQEVGGMGQSNGAVAESYFVNSFTNAMQFAGQEYDEMDHNLRKKNKKLGLQGEYDLVLYNCTSVVMIEIKYKADMEDIEELLEKAPIFKQLFPQYANFDLYLGLAALHFNKKVEKESVKHGIAIIKQVGDTMVINDAHLKVF